MSNNQYKYYERQEIKLSKGIQTCEMVLWAIQDALSDKDESLDMDTLEDIAEWIIVRNEELQKELRYLQNMKSIST